MADIRSLEILVEVDITKALSSLRQLNKELGDLGDKIDRVDANAEIGVRTHLDSIDDDLTVMSSKIESWEAANSVDIATNVQRDLGAFGTTGGGGGMDMDLFPRVGSALAGGGPSLGDSAEESAEGLGRISNKVNELMEPLDRVTRSFEDADIRMTDVHNAAARLVPMLLLFLGALPAVVTAIYGLAAAAIAATAALAAIGGFGLLGIGLEGGQFQMQNLTDVFNRLRDSFIDAFAPLAERLEPLARDAVDGMETLFQEIASTGGALVQLTDQARAFGGFVLEFVPEMLRTVAAFVNALGPLLGDVAGAIQRGFGSAMRTLVEITAAATPAAATFVQIIVGAIPELVAFSIQFLHVANAIMMVIGVLYDVITLFGLLDNVLGFAVASVLAVFSAALLLNSALVTFAGATLKNVIVALTQWIAGLITSQFAVSSLTASVLGLVGAVALLTGGLSIIGGILSLGAGFLGLSTNIDKATRSLKRFDNVANRTDSSFNPYGGDREPGEAADLVTGRGGTTINIETSGDRTEDRANARYASWRQGRTTGGNN